ncbi:hypothetical protein F441_15962 [Phytophthora nicotianae CJ01A1]|uniref:Uncharacterized protein n=6 Tax=Phytophthora nicotianae TaxID=4792 RepID=W2PRB7_PHYN3|nr:hypothetical protein PPTG_15685 [Phytophthora nicotianae INRA-310]ETI38036.1 hypothetical protein F443_16133 [Phytophthora nicotianae P1569]ETK78250.1 hypothetical protein L915_15679 [Phytophthora nicotianae]ETO66805.1 hypothetical protein F444_16118 [Phytophthora nicotianae P1976]ETP07926.1 hypothetical protein F441_15962 [Phytophthora nicotianae CJ01A1]ETP35956.1 hypothetical protein F442_15986 [Phytophthora nicotianae P10297]KUF76772.1 hypothetical protein AM587_10011158 [Phytophthora n
MQPGSADTSASAADAPQDEAQQARDWWGARELEVERELATNLQRRMEAQRTQLYAFKTEQSKWEHELQLRISKYAHDRKLLSEHNVELQEELTVMEEKFAQHQREMDLQVQRVIELEGMLHDNQIDTQQMRELRDQNDELQQRLRQWERFYREEKVLVAKEQKTQHDELLTELERLLAVSEDELVQPQQVASSSDRDTGKNTGEPRNARRRKDDAEDDPLVTRIKELEAACKQKDQAIYSLKGVLEKQETAFDEKLKIVTAKYDQVKSINMALQKRLMHALTEGAGKS